MPMKGAKKQMKRITAILLAVMLAFGLAACGESQSGSQTPGAVSGEQNNPVIPQSELPDRDLITGGEASDLVKEGSRPVAIMIDNVQAALPQRGIASADAIFEMVTEGGITRLMALFSDRTAVPNIGPVRSARDQYVQCAMPLNAMLVHIGTSIYAENLMNQYNYPSLNGVYLGSTSFAFDEARKAEGFNHEHCWYTDAEKIAAGVEKSGLSVTGAGKPLFDFLPQKSAPVVPDEGAAPDIAISFSDLGNVTLTYDEESGRYLKTAYGEPHVDSATGEQLAFDNVVVLFTEVKRKNPDDPNNIVMDFDMQGGTGYYCYGGHYRKISWKKGEPEDPIRFKDEAGNPVQLNVGKSYTAIVGNDRAEMLLFGGVNPAGVIGGEEPVQDAPQE